VASTAASPATRTCAYRIIGLDCAEEVAILRKQLEHRPGVEALRFDILNAKMTVDFDAGRIQPAQIIGAVASTGMSAEVWSDTRPAPATFWQRHQRSVIVAVSGLAMVAAMVAQGIESGSFVEAFFAHEHGSESHGSLPVVVLSILGILCGSFYVWPKAAHSLKRLQPDMNLLVVISLIGAGYLGEWLEGASLAFLFGLAAVLESWAMARARNAVMTLMNVTPGDAAVVHGDHEHRVPVGHVAVGATVRVRPGERIPCDGEVVTGTSDVNQAMITGEPLAVYKAPGDPVWAGTVNGDGLLEVRTTRPAGDTAISRIIRMVERAQHYRAPAEQFVERFARIYTPIMLVLALMVAVVPPLLFGGDWSKWFYQCMVILLISCPCALVISTPVTVVAALTAAARKGILVKGGAYLEVAARIRALAFDKTGVLTQGLPVVRELVPLSGRSEADVLERLAALEHGSSHPVARAVVRYAEQQGVHAIAAVGLKTVQGKGAEAAIAGEHFWAGSLRMVEDKGLANDELRQRIATLAAHDGMTMAFGTERETWALVGLADPVRPEAGAALDQLRQLGLRDMAILTGDHEAAARFVGRQLGVERIFAGLLPEDKDRVIGQLAAECDGHIAMVGDGVNDAQAMTRASLGIAFGQTGADAVMETADVVLVSGGIGKLPDLIRIARQTVSIIHQNIVLALALKAAVLVMALFGETTLWMAILADMGATMLVIFNGLRMLGRAH
jgi:Zn2+/Cd2+-exporting ATPase